MCVGAVRLHATSHGCKGLDSSEHVTSRLARIVFSALHRHPRRSAGNTSKCMWRSSSPAVSRWNSFSSSTSVCSGPLSVMDILNLWDDDPEEVLLDLGFGCEEPDLSGRIPARFINHQSQARGINLQLFLEAQKSRLDLENPDVSNRFRQLEVLQQVTTAFSCLVGSSSTLRAPQGQDLPPDARERRARVAMLLRRASKKALSQIHNHQTQDLTIPSDTSPPCAAPEALQPSPSLGDEKVLKRVKPALLETVCVSPVAEEQGDGDPQQQQALSCQSGQRTESPNSERPGPSPSPPHTLLLSSPLTPSGDDKSLPTALCPSPEPTLVFGPSLSPESPKCDLEMLETKTQPYQDLSPPASLPASKKCDYLPPSSSSPQLQNTSPYQTQTLTSISSSDSLPPLSAPMQPASLINESDLNKTEDRAAPPPHCCTLFHDSVAVSSVPPPASFPSSLHNLDDCLSATVSSTQIDSTSVSPEDTQSEWNGMASCENSLPISTGLSSLVPSPYYSNPSAPFHFNSPYSSVSLSQNLKNNQKDSLFQDSGGMGFSDQPNDTQKQKGCVRLPCLSLNSSTPDGQSPDLDLGKMSYLAEQSISHQDRCSNNENEEPAPASPVQDSIHVKMDHSSLDLEDTLQSNGTAEVGGESHTDTVQTSSGLSDGYLLVSKKICKETEIDPQLPSCIFRDGLSAETIQREIQFCQMEMKGRESESSRSSSVLHDEVVGAHCRSEIEPKDLIEIENIDMVFQTSVDSSEGDEEDVETFFQQLDTERLVYWAEPIQVSDSTYVVDESGTSEDTDVSPGSFILPRGPDSLDSFVSTYTSSKTMDTVQTSGNATAYLDTTSSLTLAPFQSLSIIPDLKQSSRSFSVQMSSSPSSHIVNRKDVPYMTNSKSPLLSSVFALDTSTPFRAVQSWKDLQIQRNTITKMLSHGALDTFPSKVSVSTSASETTQRSLSPSLLSNDWQSQCCLSGTATNSCTVSVSEDNGHDEEEQVNNIRNEDEVKLWEVNQKDSMACCCSFDHPCTCCTQKSYNKLHPLGNITDSLDVMGEMMSCLQQFGFVLSHIEKQLSEDQAAVYTSLSDLDREKIRDIEKLRCAVKQETAELEMQLNELSDHNNDSVKKKMHRLLGEQSLLCSQLRVFVPGMVSPPQRRAPKRTVSTQCCMLPWIEEPPGTHSLCRGLGCSPSKADRLDIVGFLQRLKESFRNSSNTDLFE